MMKRLLLVILFTSFAGMVFSQKQEKVFYDKDWKGCSQSKAEYYRLVTFDSDGKPIGKVYSYYITSELYGEIDSALYIDKNDDNKSKFIGFCKEFYKNGNIQAEGIYKNGEYDGDAVSYYENGNMKGKFTFKDGKANGDIIAYYENGNFKRKQTYKYGVRKDDAHYYENGELKRKYTIDKAPDGYDAYYYENGNFKSKYTYKNGELDKFYTDCDEFGICQKIFRENFDSDKNPNKWILEDKKDYTSKIIPEKGLLMENKIENKGFRQTIHIPIDITEDFSIETIVDFKKGSDNTGHGLIWGFKDWNNYYYFLISANGYYKIGAKTDGLIFEFQKWETSQYINKNASRNTIKVNRVNDKMYYSINGRIVFSEDFYSLKGNHVGFYISSGQKEVLFENLIVKQDISVSQQEVSKPSSEEWQGNGTGFFIDRRGYIATNHHVISDASEIEIEFTRNGQKQIHKAKLIHSDKQNDLAILKIEDNSFRPFTNLPCNFQTKLSDVGSDVFALGYPMASIMGTEIKFTDGKISSKTGIQGDVRVYQISVPIQPGNSGGPLFDYDGNLVGITSAGLNLVFPSVENVNYAIKTSYLKNLIEVLPISLNLPNDQTIANKTLTEKIKILSDYVVLIKIK